jgi:hypothetical protein
MLSFRSEFSGINFGSKLKKRFIKTMETPEASPQKSIYLAGHNRAEAKAIYRLLGNDSFDISEVKRSHKSATIERIKSSGAVILAVQDTTSINYSAHKKTEGLGYCCDNTLGINVHSCLAVTGDGVVLGVLEQSAITRLESKDLTLPAEKRKRPIEEKESNRWLVTMTQSMVGIPDETKVIHVCDREGDMYELFEKAQETNQTFLIRVAYNRHADDDKKIIDTIKEVEASGRLNVLIPRNSRDNTKERSATLEISYREFNVKKPQSLAHNQELSDAVPITIIYVKETTRDGMHKIEWILGTNERINSFEDACKMVKYYALEN